MEKYGPEGGFDDPADTDPYEEVDNSVIDWSKVSVWAQNCSEVTFESINKIYLSHLYKVCTFQLLISGSHINFDFRLFLIFFVRIYISWYRGIITFSNIFKLKYAEFFIWQKIKTTSFFI